MPCRFHALPVSSERLDVHSFINGFGVGILTGIVPSYVAEISKPRIRGLMMSLELVFAATVRLFIRSFRMPH